MDDKNFDSAIVAINDKDEDTLKRWLDNSDFRLNFSELYGKLLEHAAKYSSYEIIGILLGEEIPENNALIYAVERRDKIITALILSEGVYTDKIGIEAIKIACNKEYEDILFILRSYIIVEREEFKRICENVCFLFPS